MREYEVEQKFAGYLESQGWTVVLDDRSHVDIIAEHPDGSRLLAEVKGETRSSGVAFDILFGQLLRRMHDLSGKTRHAVVIPESLVRFVLRVPEAVRERLGLEAWVVPSEGDPKMLDCSTNPNA